MNQNKSGRKYIKWLLPLIVLILGGGALYTIIKNISSTEYEQVRTKAELNAVTYANRMVTDLNAAVNVTNSLKNILISENGRISEFDTVAESMMDDYIQSIQLAPDGVVTDIYPEKGNEAGKIDLVHDEKRGGIVNYGIEHDIVVMQGPFQLNQGGYGIAVRTPVYLKDEDGERYFWGLTIVIIRVPEIFNDSVKSLSEFGYQYRLFKTDSQLSKEYKLIDESATELDNPVSHIFNLGGCQWKLEVMPDAGWHQKKSVYFVGFSGIIMIMLFEGLTLMLLSMENQRRIFKKMAVTDGLTKLLNRNGFNERMDNYINNEHAKHCTGIMLDVDNFKFINDVYGHEIGDRVLVHLAKSLTKAFPSGSIVGRNGGDEFCVILKDCNSIEASKKIEEFVNNTDRCLYINGKEYNYGISLGYAVYPDDAKKITELTKYADMALYEVKLNGKHGYKRYSEGLHISKRTQLGFKLEDISKNLPGAVFIYKAERDNEKILYANRGMIQLTGCDSLDDFYEFTERKFGNLIHPDDLKQVENSIWNQISINDGEIDDYVKYRMKTKDGSYRNVLDFGRIVDSEYYGHVFYVLIVDYDYIIKREDDGFKK